MPVFHSIQNQDVDAFQSIDMTLPISIQSFVVARNGLSPNICDCLT